MFNPDKIIGPYIPYNVGPPNEEAYRHTLNGVAVACYLRYRVNNANEYGIAFSNIIHREYVMNISRRRYATKDAAIAAIDGALMENGFILVDQVLIEKYKLLI